MVERRKMNHSHYGGGNHYDGKDTTVGIINSIIIIVGIWVTISKYVELPIMI